MKLSKKTKFKQFMAAVMIMVLILTNSNISVLAEGEETPTLVDYTVSVHAGSKTLDNSYISEIKEKSSGAIVTPNNGKYSLDESKEYLCEISGTGINSHEVKMALDTTNKKAIASGDATSVQLEYESELLVGKTVKPKDDGLGITWLWSITDTSGAATTLAAINEDDGSITATGAGNVKITKTDSADKGFKVSKEFEIKEKKDFKIKIYDNGQDLTNLVDTGLTIDGVSVDASKDTCSLEYGKSYTYSLEKQGFETISSAELTTPTKESNDDTIEIEVDLKTPVLKVNNRELSANTTIKADETVTVNCSNYSELYPGTWKYIYTVENDKNTYTCTLGENFEFTTPSNTAKGTFSMVVGEDGKEESPTYDQLASMKIEVFNDYQVSYRFMDTTVERVNSVTFSDRDGTESSELKSGEVYTIKSIDVTGLTFADDTEFNEYIAVDCFEQHYTIPLPEKSITMTTPEIEINDADSYTGICGSQVTITIKNEDDLYSPSLKDDETGWEWKSNYPVEIDNDNKLTLGDKVNDPYKISYTFKNKVTSNEVTVTSQQIPLTFAENIVLSGEKNYDGTESISVELDVNTTNFGMDASIANIPNDTLIITGKVDSADAGTYTTFTVTDINVKNDDETLSELKKYDISGLMTTLEKQNFVIKQLEFGATIRAIPLSYHTKEYNPVNMYEFIMLKDITENISLEDKEKVAKQTLINALGDVFKVPPKDETTTTVTWGFKGLGQANGTDMVVNTTNMKFNIVEPKTNSFITETSKQIIEAEDVDVWSLVTLQQGGKALTKGQWINSGDITAQWKDTSYKASYPNIYFRKLDNLDQIENIYGVGEKEDTPFLLSISDLKNADENTYYQMVFCTSDGMFNTLAAVICIVGENNSQKELFTTLQGSDGVNYHVYNFKLDNSADVVDMKDADSAEYNLKEYAYAGDISKITFSSVPLYKGQKEKIDVVIKNTGAPNNKVYYAITKPTENVSAWTLISADSIAWKDGEGTCQVELPATDGDYIVYIKTVNEVGAESQYVSDKITIDDTAPAVSLNLSEKTYTEILEEGRIYLDDYMPGTFTVEERNIETVEVTVEATNRKGEKLENGFTAEDMERFEASLKSIDSTTNKATTELKFNKDANYVVTVKALDKAGNETVASYHFTVDTIAPEIGKIDTALFIDNIVNDNEKDKGIIKTARETIEKAWNSFVEYVLVDIFTKETVGVTLYAEDSISNVSVSYYIADKGLSSAEVSSKDIEWVSYAEDTKVDVAINQRAFIYMRAEDKSGNMSYYNAQGIITDNVKPSVEITVTEEANDNQFYNGNVSFKVNVTDTTASEQEAAAGLQYVGYRIEKDGKISKTVVKLDASKQKSESYEKSEFDVTVDADENNSNDVILYITAVDNAGNKTEQKKSLKIDNVKPEITVEYDDTAGADYYSHNRTATITIKERNLDTKDVKLSVKTEHGSKAVIGKWTHTDNIEKSDEATYTCKVTFDADDDYTFTVDCVDKAGNKAKKAFTDEFTIDQTVPAIEVSYNGGQVEQNGFYNEAITATITITEHNFNAEKANIQVLSGETVTAGGAGFNSNGDTHTSSVVLDQDGTYRVEVSYVDEAGNSASDYAGNTFTVDLKIPEITITNVADRSANKGDVKPVITCTDENYDEKQVTISVRGANGGEVELSKIGYVSSPVENGEQFSFDFPKTEELDDVYVLTAKMLDKAGNETESSVEFSVNRYGSVYTIGTETGEWLINGECAYLQEGKPVVIIETNVDEVVERNISYTLGGISAETVTVEEKGAGSGEEVQAGQYYEISEENTGSSWHRYRYELSAENFAQEGNYAVQIDSVDKAGNHTNNTSNKHNNSNMEILFAVDRTAPSAVVSGTENGGIYNEAEHTVMLDVQDNIALEYVSVYLNGEEYATYQGEEMEELENGVIPVVVKESISSQTIQLKAQDKAGNILGEKTSGTYDAEFKDFDIIVTRNIFIQVLHRYWMLLLLAVVAIVGVIVFVVMKRKKSKE